MSADQGRIERTIAALCEMHNHPPRRIGWVEQTTLRDAVQLLKEAAAVLGAAERPHQISIGPERGR